MIDTCVELRWHVQLAINERTRLISLSTELLPPVAQLDRLYEAGQTEFTGATMWELVQSIIDHLRHGYPAPSPLYHGDLKDLHVVATILLQNPST
jgi:hypothetical protein